jgi:hypothetical protein
MIVYHYTTKGRLSSILKTRRFFPSYFSTTLDSAWGEGWYFTDLPPSRSNRVLYELWGQAVPGRVKCYLAFNIDPSFLEETRPHVYKLALENITDRELDLNLQYTYGEAVVIRFTRHGFR